MSMSNAASDEVTALILELFRLNGRLLSAGDRLVADLGLTSARWQVLGAIALSVTPEPVARLARNMGIQRQGVQRIVNELVDEGFVALKENSHHRRARLVVLTDKGSKTYAAATRRQRPWAERLSKGLKAKDLISTRQLLAELRLRLEEERDIISG